MKISVTLLLVFLYLNTFGQNPIINEVDADTEGVDTKEFIEIKTDEPFLH